MKRKIFEDTRPEFYGSPRGLRKFYWLLPAKKFKEKKFCLTFECQNPCQ